MSQFIEDMDAQLAAQSAVVKEALKGKVAKQRLAAEANCMSKYHFRDTVWKCAPVLNKCVESSWDGSFTITALLPPVNCKLIPQGQKAVKAKVSTSKPN